MTDLRLVRIMEECDESIHKLSEALKDIDAGMALPAETKKLLRRLGDRASVIEQQLETIENDYEAGAEAAQRIRDAREGFDD